MEHLPSLQKGREGHLRPSAAFDVEEGEIYSANWINFPLTRLKFFYFFLTKRFSKRFSMDLDFWRIHVIQLLFTTNYYY